MSDERPRSDVPIVVLAIGLCCGLPGGCAMPAAAKLAKPVPKPSQDHFSCGEKCPPAIKSIPLSDHAH